MIAIEKPQLPKLPKLKFGEGTFAYTDNGAIAYKKYIKLSDGSTIRKTILTFKTVRHDGRNVEVRYEGTYHFRMI